ncbi:unnamed protein product [Calypogeia fissa]
MDICFIYEFGEALSNHVLKVPVVRHRLNVYVSRHGYLSSKESTRGTVFCDSFGHHSSNGQISLVTVR